jgi:hypothetical protein
MNLVRRFCLILAAGSAVIFSSVWPTNAQTNESNILNRKASELYQAGKYSEAIPLAQRALAIREASLGPDHPDVAQSPHGRLR